MKFRIAVAVCLAVLCSRAASAQTSTGTDESRPALERTLKMPVFVWASAVAFDQLTTYEFSSRYRDVIREDNPFTRGLEDHPALIVAVGTAVDVTTGWLSYRLLNGHPRLARLAFYGAAAYRGYLAVHNIRLMQNAREDRALGAVSVSMGLP